MSDAVKLVKAAIAAGVAALTALWGWFGWLVVGWILCMAREGLWHKAGCVAAVAASGMLDMVVALLLEELPKGALPFEYTVFLCPLAVVWYLLTEVGSVVENAGAMGAPIPGWLRRAVASLRDRVDESL